MSVILEFSIANDGFQLGEVLTGQPDMHLELERVVPTGQMIMPFVWATGENHAAFEEKVRAHPLVKELRILDKFSDSALYRIEWDDSPTDLIEGIAQSDGIVLEARGGSRWTFRLRFPDHDKLSSFHNFVLERDLPIHIDRTYTLTEPTDHGHRFDLSTEQREALLLALERGYFASPSEIELEALADELDISRQALSTRIRTANEQVLQKALLRSADDYD